MRKFKLIHMFKNITNKLRGTKHPIFVVVVEWYIHFLICESTNKPQKNQQVMNTHTALPAPREPIKKQVVTLETVYTCYE